MLSLLFTMIVVQTLRLIDAGGFGIALICLAARKCVRNEITMGKLLRAATANLCLLKCWEEPNCDSGLNPA